MPRRRRRPFYSMGFARSAVALDIICAAGEASGSGVWRRLTRGRAQACVAWRRRAGAGREYRGAPGSARCLRSVPRQERLVSLFAFRAPHRVRAKELQRQASEQQAMEHEMAELRATEEEVLQATHQEELSARDYEMNELRAVHLQAVHLHFLCWAPGLCPWEAHLQQAHLHFLCCPPGLCP